VLGRLIKGWRAVGRIQRLIKEGKDVHASIQVIQEKYGDLPLEVQKAWIEIEEFLEALRDVFSVSKRDQTKHP
jgi:siroheme synthase (precorrin-2 oxidase/ferrochelatase)